MKSNFIIFPVLALLVGTMAYFSFRSPGNNADSASGVAGDESPRPGQGSATDNRDERLRQLEDQVARLSAAAARSPTAEQPKPDALLLGQAPAQAAAFKRKAISHYDQGFLAAASNPRTDATLRAAALGAVDAETVSNLASPPQAADADCRGEMCRITAMFTPGSDPDAWATAYILEVADQFPGTRYFLETQSSGDIRMHLYLFAGRENRSMALIDSGLY